jgi:hypothetical protein
MVAPSRGPTLAILVNRVLMSTFRCHGSPDKPGGGRARLWQRRPKLANAAIKCCH